IADESTRGGDKLLRMIGPYGFNSNVDGLQLDHVHEIQFGGHKQNDTVKNLWPLKSSLNARKGSALSRAPVEYPRTHNTTIAQLKLIKSEEVTKREKFFFQVKNTE